MICLFAIDAAKKSNVKEAESEVAIRNWLKYAADRSGGRKRHLEKKRRTFFCVFLFCIANFK